MEKESDDVLFTWSGGKDSAMALLALRREGRYSVKALLTSVTADYDRISMHGVRRELLEQQAASAGIPLEVVTIPKGATNEEYEEKMRDALKKYRSEGVLSAVFGDIFLEDLRRYRIERLKKLGMRALFPLWMRNTRELAGEFVRLGFKAVITCVDTEALDGGFAGRELDAALLAALPASVDPCGENGEFHSFVYDGPIFRKPIPIRRGKRILRDGRFRFCDLTLEPPKTKDNVRNIKS